MRSRNKSGFLGLTIFLNYLARIQSELLTPVVFLPGYGGNPLYITVNSTADVPELCDGTDIPIGEPGFMALPTSFLDSLNPTCLYALLTMDFNGSAFLPLPGISVGPKHFGSFKGISSVYWSFAQTLESWGYAAETNLFGAPYDYRYMSPSALARNGFVAALQTLVEQASNINGGRPVMLIGHSNGGPTMYSFLASVPAAWRAQYIAGMIGLSGNFLGQLNGYESFLYSPDLERLFMLTSWEATYTTASWGGYPGLQAIDPVVTTYKGTSQESNYSVALTSMTSLFESAGHADWAARLRAAYPSMDRTLPPSADTYCLFGTALATTASFAFAGPILEASYVSAGLVEGDSNQDLIDNAFCEEWAGKSGYKFTAQGFPGVHHMDMVSDDSVLAQVRIILDSYVQT